MSEDITVRNAGSVAPVLAALALTLRPKRILELGAGGFSTKIFVDRNVFRYMERVDSFENGPDEYKQQCRALFGKDTSVYKLQFFDTNRLMIQIIKPKDLTIYDLILVDDSFDGVTRARTIRHITANQPDHQVVVIHDYNVRLYPEAVEGNANQFVFTAVNPFTAVLWKQAPIQVQFLTRINELMKAEITSKAEDKKTTGIWWRGRIQAYMENAGQ